ncbi:MAG TPA: hypothetical protein IAB62_09735 [Candidatus Coprocola pullicola]|nr:hypothetical protein [Candidatus Coprocola pullicola]
MHKNQKAFFLLFLSIVFIVIGFARKEVDTVFLKSVNICLECIGIG